MAADRAAARAMRAELDRLPILASVVIGESEHGSPPSPLGLGQSVGAGKGPLLDLAVAPLEGSTLCAKDMPGAISAIAMAKAGSLLRTPEVYMDKIAIGPGYPAGLVDLDREPRENIEALAHAKNVKCGDITVCVLDRPRHTELIEKCRAAGASVRLISDGDVAGVILTAQSRQTGVDIFLGRGGAREGVLAAGALRCVGGQMQGRLAFNSSAELARVEAAGIENPYKKYDMTDLASGDVIVCATGVTEGPLLEGVGFGKAMIATETVVYHSYTGTVRRIRAEHRADRLQD